MSRIDAKGDRPRAGAQLRAPDVRRRPPILIVLGFLAAFVLTVLTVVLTGLYVKAPDAARGADGGWTGAAPAEIPAPEIPGQ